MERQAGSYTPSPQLRWSPLGNCSDYSFSTLPSSTPQPCLHVALQAGVPRSSSTASPDDIPPPHTHLLML